MERREGLLEEEWCGRKGGGTGGWRGEEGGVARGGGERKEGRRNRRMERRGRSEGEREVRMIEEEQ